MDFLETHGDWKGFNSKDLFARASQLTQTARLNSLCGVAHDQFIHQMQKQKKEASMLKGIVKKMVGIVLDKPLPIVSSEEKVFLSELKTDFDKLPVLGTARVIPSEAAWSGFMNRLRELVLTENPREFLRWDVIAETMFVSFARFLPVELKYLKHRPNWNTRWRKAMKESSVGHPRSYFLYPASSGNLIHHAYHVAQFEEITKQRVDGLDFVFEFGGGYGSMCRLFHNLGFQGKYIIFDLPPFSALQRYFLKTLGLPVQSITEFARSKRGIVCVSDIQQLRALIADQIEGDRTMFVATWSISESPVSVRDMILPLTHAFRSYLISYQYRFGEVDNVAFFEDWKESVKNVTWHSWRIEHIPGNTYLMGQRLGSDDTKRRSEIG